MDEALIADVIERLDVDTELVPQTGELVLAALLGEGEVDACLGGTSPARPELEPTPAASPCRAYVKALTVEGFRGIGPTSRVELSAGPGLTLVIGRNGSGKSSYAEALELLLTGDSQRWSSRRSKIWKDGWRNLHHQGSITIEAEILIDGEPGPTSLHRSWTADDDVTGGTTRLQRGGRTLASLAPLGWEEPLKTYRPFLSYNELGSMLEEGPSRLYDALGSIFGLEDLVDAATRLAEVRKERTAAHKAVKDKLGRLRRVLEQLDDERAKRCLAALKGTKWRLDEVEALVTGDRPAGGPDSELDRLNNLAQLPGPDLEAVKAAISELRTAAAEVERVRATDANRARTLAGLLQRALEFHDQEGDGDCPVCGRDGALDADWHRHTETAIGDLRTQADVADQAHRRCAAAEQRTRTLLAPPPQVLEHAAALGVDPSPLCAAWESWRAAQEKAGTALAAALEERAVELAAAVGKVRDEAQRKLDERQDAWREVALDVAGWLPEARRMMSEKELVKQVKTAEAWLNETATQIRNERFQPIKEQVKSYWELLRARSSVDIEDVTFGGRATRRRVNLDVTVDGTEGAALGVMSQGELHALALCLFLPRATLEFSPFRFLMIDDPVQAMDPARVDGLARAFATVARDRQVVVFTHDDRLPEAVRRQAIEATVLEVQRREGSEVEVRKVDSPLDRYFSDAWALTKTRELPPSVVDRVVPGLCRQGLETACIEVVRRRRLARGESHHEVEELLTDNSTLMLRLALALCDDPAKGSEVRPLLSKKFGPRAGEVVDACNRGAHGRLTADYEFVREIQKLAKRIIRLS